MSDVQREGLYLKPQGEQRKKGVGNLPVRGVSRMRHCGRVVEGGGKER